jgi:hypothetical protein
MCLCDLWNVVRYRSLSLEDYFASPWTPAVVYPQAGRRPDPWAGVTIGRYPMVSQSSSVAVIGVGIMGSAIARNLIAVDALRRSEADVTAAHVVLARRAGIETKK